MKLKKAFCIMVIFVLMMSQFVTVYAETYGTATTTGSYTYRGKIVSGSYTHYIYKNTYNWIVYYPSKKLTAVVYHSKNSGSDTLSYSQSQTESKTKTCNWSTNASITSQLGASSGLFTASISASVSYGYGTSSTSGYSYTSSYNVSKTIESSAKTGYYTRVPGYTYYKIKDRIVHNTQNSLDYIYYNMPYGSSVIYTIYSSNNSSWSIY